MPVKYIVVPEQVCFDERLPPMARLLYGCISSLASKDGYCWATNAYLAEQFHVKLETISRAIKILSATGYIRLEFDGNGNAKRRVYPCVSADDTLDENVNVPLTKLSMTLDENVNVPLTKKSMTLDKNVNLYNRMININNNTKDNCAFAQFWTAYPKKRDKAKARKTFEKLNPDSGMLADMIRALEWQRITPQWTKDNGQYVPLPTTWLNGRRWEDEPETPSQVPDKPCVRLVKDADGRIYETND